MDGKATKDVNYAEVLMVSVPKDWRAGKAWFCVACLVLSQVVVAILAALVSQFVIGRPLATRPVGNFMMNATGGLLALFVTFLFARPTTFRQFRDSFALKKPKLSTALLVLASGAAFAGATVLLIKGGFRVPHNPLTESFSVSGPAGLFWLDLLLITVPLVEEFIMRGYLYPAFRQSYSITWTLVSILAIASVTHFSQVTSSIVGAASVICFNVMVCLIREKSDSLWNCVLCHLAFNLVCALI